MLLITAQKRLANRGIQIQKDSDDYSFEKGSLIFEFISVDGDTVVNFQAWNKETQETFYFANFKNMMIYFDGLEEIQDTQEIQAVPVKIKTEPSVIEEPEVEEENKKIEEIEQQYTPVFLFEEMENEHQKAIENLKKIVNDFKASREDQEAEIIEENRQFFIRLLMNKVSEIEIRMIISMHINMINLGEYEIEYNEDEEYTIQQVYDFFKEREMVIEYCETVDVNEEYFTKREKEVFDYALSLCTRPVLEPEPEKNTQKKEVNQYPKFRKKKFEYDGCEIRIADIEEKYLNSTVVMTRCIAPNNEPFGPALGRGESLNDLIDKVKKAFTKAEKNGIDIARWLKEVGKNYTADEIKIYGVCPYCGNNITKNDLTSMKKYVCKGCKIDFDEDEWNTIQEAFDWALSAL